MGELISLTWPSHSKMLLDGLWNLIKENYKTDFKVSTCDSVTCHAHQLILAIFCPSLVKGTTENHLNLTMDCDFIQEDLQAIMEFVYLGKVTVDEIRLVNILAGATSLGLQPLIQVINEVRIQRNHKKIINRASNRNRRHPKKPTKSTIESKTEKNHPEEEFEVKISKSSCEVLTDARRDQHACDFCDKRFVSRDRFLRHLRCHQNPENLQQCPRCEYKTGEKYILIQHMASRHRLDADGNPLARDLKCPHCDFKCVSNFQLRNHAFHKHSTKAFKCAECDYSCVKKADHDKHVRAKHRNLRPYLCEQCGYRGKTLSAFKCHMRTHTGERPFICDVCGQSFSLSGTLKCHQKVHGNEEKPHPCHLCSFSTWKRYNLKVHLKHVHKDVFINDAVCEKVTAEWRDMKNKHSRSTVETAQMLQPSDNNYCLNQLQSFLI